MVETIASPTASVAAAASAMGSRDGSPLVANNAAAGAKRKRTTEKKFYAVREGRSPGVYSTWSECQAQVCGHKGALFKAFLSLQEANAFVDGTEVPSPTGKAAGEQKFYAVQNGKQPGVYLDWPSALAQIRGMKKPRYRKFNTMAEAQAFVDVGKKNLSSDLPSSKNLSPEEEARQSVIRKSAPGLVVNGVFQPKDREGNPYPLGTGPLPPGAEDHFDPNLKLAADGTIQQKTEEEKAKTKTVVKDKDPPNMLYIWTDGSSLGNGYAGARAGIGVYFGPEDPKNLSEPLKGPQQTNQRAELTAILRALDVAPRYRDITICTDSKYAIECSVNWYKRWEQNGWKAASGKPVENKDIIMEIRERIEERDLLNLQTLFCWIKGHSTNEGNIAADKLAVAGSSMERDPGNEQDKVSSGNEKNGQNSEANATSGVTDEVAQAWKDMMEAAAANQQLHE